MAIGIGGKSATAQDVKMDYLNLLVTQLQHQNPLEPLDNNEMAAQLAQFSQLEQLENMNTSFGRTLHAQERNEAVALIGKQVTFFPAGSVEAWVGEVEGVNVTDTKVTLQVGAFEVELSDIQEVTD